MDLTAIFTEAMRRPTIICDVDNTLAWTDSQKAAIANAMFGLNINVATNRDLHWESTELTAEQGAQLQRVKSQDIYWLNIVPDYEAISALKSLANHNFDIIVASNRDPSLYGVTERWLETWDVPYDRLVLKGPSTKMVLARENDPCIVIEDDPRNVLALDRQGTTVWVPDRAYTPEWVRSGMAHAWVFHTWAQVLDTLIAT